MKLYPKYSRSNTLGYKMFLKTKDLCGISDFDNGMPFAASEISRLMAVQFGHFFRSRL